MADGGPRWTAPTRAQLVLIAGTVLLLGALVYVLDLLAQVPFRWFVLATALGEIPKVGTFTYVGAAAGGVSSWLTARILLTPALGLIALRLLRSRWHPGARPGAGEVQTRRW